MTTHVMPSSQRGRVSRAEAAEPAATHYLAPLGRLLFSVIFLLSAPGHFTAMGVEYGASAGVPLPGVLVPVAGLFLIIGGLSVLLGYHARVGAALLLLFLVPVTFYMHRFWGIDDPAMAQMQQVHFIKNVSLMGGALLLIYFGAGPVSLDARHTHRAT